MTKQDLRATALAHRDALSSAQREDAARAIAARGFPVATAHGAVVAGYAAMRGEIDPALLMQTLAARGARLALPCIVARGQPLLFREWSLDEPLTSGPHNTREPPEDAPLVAPDIVLAPLAAFDRAGHRIGYGGGYYDRTLAQLRAAGPVIAIGLAFAVQEVAAIPAGPHDARLDYVLTESQIIDFRS